jgi:diacylglycerol kinase (ATP)
MPRHRVALLFNPVSGSGRARARADALARSLAAADIDAEPIATRPGAADEWLPPFVEGLDALVVVGGDGAVRLAAPVASATGVPLHHVGAGTENLFGRSLGMSGRPEDVVAAIRARRIGRMDLGLLDGEPFVLMASAGFDAEVVHEVAARRGSRISHATYIPVIARQLGRWRAGSFLIRVDNGPEEELGRGVLVIANAPAYALRMDPARGAVPTDGLLDVAFLPCVGSAGAVCWILQCVLRRGSLPGGVRRRGGRIEVVTEGRWQADGDPLARVGGTACATVRPGALPVLLPARPAPSEPIRAEALEPVGRR